MFEKRLEVPWHGFIGNWQTPMTPKQSEMFVQLLMLEKQGDTAKQEAMHADMQKVFAYAVMTKRFEVMNILQHFSIPLMLFTAIISENVGDVVMWAYTLNYIRVLENLDKVTIEKFVDYFPMGFPNAEEKHKIWDAQKGFNMDKPFDNWVDATTWPGV